MVALLQRPVVAALATINADGSPHLTDVWFEFDGAKLYVAVSKNTVKFRNARREPRIALSIRDPENQTRYVTVSGRVQIVEDPGSQLIRRLSLRYMGPVRGEEFSRSVEGADRFILVMEPEKVYSYGLT